MKSSLNMSLAAAAIAVTDLAALGVHVISITVDSLSDEPRILVATPAVLPDGLEACDASLTDPRYTKRAVHMAGCEVFWLVAVPADVQPLAAREVMRQLDEAATS